jgi:hypothetical protein
MKVRLTKDRVIGSKCYGKDSVVDLFQTEVEAIIAAGEGVAVPDGTMARKKAYGVAGCMPPAGFESNIKSVFSGLAVEIAQNEPRKEGTLSDAKQKTNTLKN